MKDDDYYYYCSTTTRIEKETSLSSSSSSSSSSSCRFKNRQQQQDEEEPEQDNQTITTVASTILPTSPSRDVGDKYNINNNNSNNEDNEEERFEFHSMLMRTLDRSTGYNNAAAMDHAYQNNDDDPLTTENIEYEVSPAFLRLYQKDPTLLSVDLYEIPEESAISILSVLPNHNMLQELCLTYSGLSSTIVPVLLNIPHSLRILDLGGNHLGDAGMEALMNAITTTSHGDDTTCCALKFLNVSDNQIGTEGICAIADAVGNHNGSGLQLQSLCICQNPNIGTDGTTLALEALLQLSESLESIFCWENHYSYAAKETLQRTKHKKMYWVRPYHWESELQAARDKALRHVVVVVAKDDNNCTTNVNSDRFIDPQHYVSNLLPRTSEPFRAARQFLLENLDPPTMLDPMRQGRNPPPRLLCHKTIVSSSSLSPTTVVIQEMQRQESAANVKARLRRRREQLANNNNNMDESYSSASSIVDTGAVLPSHTTTITRMEYGRSCRRWKPTMTVRAPSSTARSDDDTNDDTNDHNDDMNDIRAHNIKTLLPDYCRLRAENRRRNVERRTMLMAKLAHVKCESQYATAKAKLEILERHQELAHQYV